MFNKVSGSKCQRKVSSHRQGWMCKLLPQSWWCSTRCKPSLVKDHHHCWPMIHRQKWFLFFIFTSHSKLCWRWNPSTCALKMLHSNTYLRQSHCQWYWLLSMATAIQQRRTHSSDLFPLSTPGQLLPRLITLTTLVNTDFTDHTSQYWSHWPQ